MKGLTWLWLNMWFLNIIIVIFQNKAFYSSHFWTWRALCCHSVWYFHRTRRHLNICAILFGMCDREMIQQVPHLSKCPTYYTLTSSTGSSNDCTWAGKPPLGTAALNISKQHRTLTLFNTGSPVSLQNWSLLINSLFFTKGDSNTIDTVYWLLNKPLNTVLSLTFHLSVVPYLSVIYLVY